MIRLAVIACLCAAFAAAQMPFAVQQRLPGGIQYGIELGSTHPTWTANLIGKWSLNSDTMDSKGANNLSWWNAGGTYSNGIAGTKCGWYGGDNNTLKFAPSGMPSANAALTVSCWIKAASNNNQIGFFGIGKPSQHLLGLFIYQHKLQVTDSAAANFFGTRVLDDNQWHHIVAVWYGGSSGPLVCWIDGTVESGTGAPTDVTKDGITQIAVGCFQGILNPFVGHIDDVALWNIALTTQQVLSVYNTSKQPWRQ